MDRKPANLIFTAAMMIRRLPTKVRSMCQSAPQVLGSLRLCFPMGPLAVDSLGVLIA